MAYNTKIVMKALLSNYHGFHSLNSLVDIGGGTGIAVAEIVRAYPSIKGVNYDLQHVVATALHFPGVKHVGGDMFENVTSGDAIFMKWIMHDWSNEDYIKILKNCRKEIPETGKVIIVDMVLDSHHNNEKKKAIFDPNLCLILDPLMTTIYGGKERREEEWKKILVEGGFGVYNIIRIPAVQSVIETFPG